MIKILPDKKAAVKELAEYIYSLNEASLKGNQKFTLALSGGNTPKLLFEELKKNYSDKIDWKNISLFWGDERCVDHKSPDSNYGEAKRLLIDHIEIPAENINAVIGENNPIEEAQRYSEVILSKVTAKNNLPCFDLVILGIGEDGHTASIFPDQLSLLKSKNVCEVAVHPSSNQKRVTITGKTLNNSKNIVFLATGEDKAKILSDIINKKNNYQNYPASHIIPKFGNLHYILDDQSSKFL